jgi:T5orf172 domain
MSGAKIEHRRAAANFTFRRLSVPLKSVYCYQSGSGDCYKVGLTKDEPKKRKRGFSTGSPVKFKPEPYRAVATEHASQLETYIHHLLDQKRTENGEFFNVTPKELDAAVDEAVAFVNESRPLVQGAKKLCRKKPNATMLDPTDEMLDTYRELREAGRELFLLEKRIEFLQSKVQVAIGENCGITGVASWEWVQRWTMNVELFRKQQPKLYEKYKRDSGSRRFCLEQIDLTARATAERGDG